MKTLGWMSHLWLIGCVWLHAESAPTAGEVVFASGFDTAAEQQAWPQAEFAKWVTDGAGNTSLRIEVPATKAAGGNMIRLPIDLTRFHNCVLTFECAARAEKVSQPAAGYLGVKFMLHYQSASQGPIWINQNDVFGTFDWKKLAFSARIAPDATSGEISLGLQGASGTAWFDAVRITVLKTPRTRPAPPVHPPPVFKGHDLPRLRGVMSPNEFRDDDLRVLGQDWKANVIRWQLTRNWGKPGTDRDLAEYDRWLNGKLADLDQVLESCRKYGIKVVIDMHSPPGGRYVNNDLAIFHEPIYQDHWVKLWEMMARRYKGHPAVWAYDLINEPVQSAPPPPGVADYLGAQVRAAKAIRAIDANTPILIEAAEWDSATGFQDLEPVDVPKLIYQVHLYLPFEFTHQGVKGDWQAVTYPGKIGKLDWDQQQIRNALRPVREFQLAYNVHIYVGEFSAIRWAPGAAAYLRDCIEVFEEYGWDWTYHAYREWDGWSVEHGSDPEDHQPTKDPTDRKQVLLKWFGQNVQPPRAMHPQ